MLAKLPRFNIVINAVFLRSLSATIRDIHVILRTTIERRLNPIDHFGFTKEDDVDECSSIGSRKNIQLDFIIFHSGVAENTYLKVKIFGKPFSGLVD